MESGTIEGAITSILEHYKAILTSSKKLPIYFFVKFAQFERVNNGGTFCNSFQIREQSSF